MRQNSNRLTERDEGSGQFVGCCLSQQSFFFLPFSFLRKSTILKANQPKRSERGRIIFGPTGCRTRSRKGSLSLATQWSTPFFFPLFSVALISFEFVMGISLPPSGKAVLRLRKKGEVLLS